MSDSAATSRQATTAPLPEHAQLRRAGPAIPVALLVAGAGLLSVGMVAHERAIRRFHRRVATWERAVLDTPPARHARHDLPAAIEAFARRNARIDGGEIDGDPRAWRMVQSGTMRISAEGKWLPFSASQTIGLREPGFTWFAKIGGAFDTEVVDAFADDRGLLEARLLGSVPVARMTGPESDIAEACRYLAELPWAPLAILANRYLHWSKLSEDVFEVTLHTGSGPASVRLRMEAGDIASAEVDERMHVPGKYLPWRGTFSDYARVRGVRVPLAAEVGWIEEGTLEDGTFRAYWRGQVLAGGYTH